MPGDEASNGAGGRVVKSYSAMVVSYSAYDQQQSLTWGGGSGDGYKKGSCTKKAKTAGHEKQQTYKMVWAVSQGDW